MDLKRSKYNYEMDMGQNVLVFNSLRNTFSSFDKEQYVKDINELDCDEKNFMIQQGVIIDGDYDEEKAAFLKYMSIIDDGLLTLIILPTMKCNFSCPYCYEEKSIGKMSDSVIDSIIEFAKQKIQTVKAIHVSWFGGEPLLCMDVIQKVSERLMKLTKVYHKNYSANMTTNGYLLNLETFTKLFFEYRVTHFQITVDGREHFHNKTRPLKNGGETYKTIMNNLLDIKEHIKSRLFTILVRTNLTKETLSDLENHVRELDDCFGDDKRFKFLFKEVGNWGGDTVDEISDKLISGREILLDKLSKMDLHIQLSGQFLFFNSSPICYAARKNTFTINPLGKMMKCTVNLDSKSNYLGDLDSKGNIVSSNANTTMKWEYCMLPNKVAEKKCEDCSLYANCFGMSCPMRYVSNNKASKCKEVEKELLTLYKYKPESFKSFKGDI